MAQKRIRMVQKDILNDRLRILYDDGSWGEIVSDKLDSFIGTIDHLVGLTLKQAKMYLGIKN